MVRVQNHIFNFQLKHRKNVENDTDTICYFRIGSFEA